MSTRKSKAKKLEELQAAGKELLRNRRPQKPPLVFLLAPLVDWFERRHIELIRQCGFPDARRGFNPVFIHLPADGCRLTELAARAGMSKQAMAELVDELIEKDYLARFPDPEDGRAKIIIRGEKGLEAHKVTVRAFSMVERELEDLVGRETLDRLRDELPKAINAVADEVQVS